MADRDTELREDINNVFDTIAFSEEHISSEAFREGLRKGEQDGKVEGYHLGFHRGIEIGREIGFYSGLTKVLINNFDRVTSKNKEKLSALIEKLNRSLEAFPRDNSEDVDLIKRIDDIRASYKKLNSLLKLNLPFPASSVMSF